LNWNGFWYNLGNVYVCMYSYDLCWWNGRPNGRCVLLQCRDLCVCVCVCVCDCVCMWLWHVRTYLMPYVSIAMWICVHMCIYKYTRMWISIYVVCAYVYICKYVYMCIGMYKDVYNILVHTYTHTYIRMYPRIYVCVWIRTCMCVNTYMYANIRICVHCIGMHRDI